MARWVRVQLTLPPDEAEGRREESMKAVPGGRRSVTRMGARALFPSFSTEMV
jgi:hypothetical protein